MTSRVSGVVHALVARGRRLGGLVVPATAGELGGMAVFVAGVWMVWEPLAVMLTGLATIAYFVGRRPDGDGD